MDKVRFTVIDQVARERLKINLAQYCIADSIDNISKSPACTDRWVRADKSYLGDHTGISRATTYRYVDYLVDRGILERHEMDRKYVRTTDKWYKAVTARKVQRERVRKELKAISNG